MRVQLGIFFFLLAVTAPAYGNDGIEARGGNNYLDVAADGFVERVQLAGDWRGDLSGMKKRRFIRVATTFNSTGFFLDGGIPRGSVWDFMTEFEKTLNEGLSLGDAIRVVFIPLVRDELIEAVATGRADIAAANLTITPERLQLVDFSVPIASDVRELLVTGPSTPRLTSLDDLSGLKVHIRRSSSYFGTLTRLAEEMSARGLEPPEIVELDERLETDKILELVANGVFGVTVADSHLAEFWSDVFPELTIHVDMPIAESQGIGWAFRKNSPELAGAVNAFLAENAKGSLLGNIIIKRYYQTNRWARNPLSPEDQARLDELESKFRLYAERYGVSWALVAAQGFQESRFDHSMVSSAGAVGLMQVKPDTAADPNVGIPDVYDLEDNIHAGIKYGAFIRDRYFTDEDIEPLDRMLFSLASYNAGPARIRGYRAKAADLGLDPDQWFGNVEQVSNRETVQYVANIFKYYIAYVEDERQDRMLKQVHDKAGHSAQTDGED